MTLNFIGKYYTSKKHLVIVHENENALKGDREIRYKGHSVGFGDKIVAFNNVEGRLTVKNSVPEIVVWWNENGEAVQIDQSVGDLKDWDLNQVVNPQGIDSGKISLDCSVCMQGVSDGLSKKATK